MSNLKKNDRVWYLYIIKCTEQYFYTGISTDVKRRVLAHKNGKGAKFTKIRTPLELVYIRKLNNIREALLAEREMKKISRDKKEKLVNEFQSNVKYVKDRDLLEFLKVNKLLKIYLKS